MTQAFAKINLEPQRPETHMLRFPFGDTSGSKKRLFVRKPGPSPLISQTEKPRKIYTQGADNEQDHKPTQSDQKTQQDRQPSRSRANKPHRMTQIFRKEGLVPFSTAKEIPSSPAISKLDWFSSLKYIQTDGDRLRAVSEMVRVKSVRMRTDPETQNGLNLDETTDKSLNSQHSDRNPKNAQKTSRQVEQPDIAKMQRSKTTKIFKNSTDNQPQDEQLCPHCQKMQKENTFLHQKIYRLQQQLQNRQQDIKILTLQLQTLKAQSISLSSEQSRMREESYLRETQIYQECSNRYETARKQLNRVSDRLKYLQIQNGVLARYKQDCNQTRRDYDRIKQQNDQLKKQINTICRMGDKYSKKDNGPSQHKKRPEANNKHYGLKVYKDEDTISLQLSQMSYEHL